MFGENTFTIVWIMIIGLFLLAGLFYIILEIIFHKTKEEHKKIKNEKNDNIIKYKKNKRSVHPAIIFVIILAVYIFGYIKGSTDQEQTKITSSFSHDHDTTNEARQEETDTINGTPLNNKIDETNSSDNNLAISKYSITYDISYSELTENEKDFYDKIISTAMNKDNTFKTDKELNFIFNTPITENESIRVQTVLHNNYPDVTFYTTRYSNAWMYHVVHLMNGLPIYTTYYFNVKYK